MSKAVTRHVVAAAIARIGERACSVKAASHRIIWWRAKLSRSALCRRHPHIESGPALPKATRIGNEQ
jgi:hypothetical protein